MIEGRRERMVSGRWAAMMRVTRVAPMATLTAFSTDRVISLDQQDSLKPFRLLEGIEAEHSGTT